MFSMAVYCTVARFEMMVSQIFNSGRLYTYQPWALRACVHWGFLKMQAAGGSLFALSAGVRTGTKSWKLLNLGQNTFSRVTVPRWTQGLTYWVLQYSLRRMQPLNWDRANACHQFPSSSHRCSCSSSHEQHITARKLHLSTFFTSTIYHSRCVCKRCRWQLITNAIHYQGSQCNAQ